MKPLFDAQRTNSLPKFICSPIATITHYDPISTENQLTTTAYNNPLPLPPQIKWGGKKKKQKKKKKKKKEYIR